MPVTHAFVNPKADGADTTVVRPINWNAAHLGVASVYSVKDPAYGALGNNSADDTTAIQAAINASVGAPGGICYFPPGIYITQPLVIPPGAVLQGVNGQSYYGASATVPNSNTISTLKLKAGSTGPLLSPYDGGTNTSDSVRMFDLNLNCNGINQPAINMPDMGSNISRFWIMERLYVCNVNSANTASGYAVYVGQFNSAVTMRDCVIFNGTSGSGAGYNGVGWYGTDGMMDNCFIGYFTSAGLTLIGGVSDITFVMHGGGIFTCGTGIAVGASGVVIDSVSIDHNYGHGIYVNNGPLLLSNLNFHSNSRTTNNNSSNVFVAAAVKVTAFSCRWSTLDPDGGSNIAKYMFDASVAATVLQEHGNFLMSGVSMGTSWSNYSGVITAPTFPATTVTVTNTTSADVEAFIHNGTSAMTVVTLNGTTTGMTIAANGTENIRLPQGYTIAFTYAGGTPTWTWITG